MRDTNHRKGGEEKEPVDLVSYKKQIGRIRAKKTVFTLVILIMLAVVGVVVVSSIRNHVYTDYEIVGTVEWSPTAGATIVPFGSAFLSYSPDGIHCINAKGTGVWDFAFTMQAPMVEVNGECVAVADRNGRVIYIFDKNGKTGEISVNSPVQRICLSEGGVVAAVLDDVTTTPIYLFYKDGTQISYFRTTMSRSGYPFAIGISENGRLVGVSYLYVDNGQMTSKVAFYNFGDVGRNETDNLVSGYDYQGRLVPYISFLDNGTAFAVSNDGLMLYEGSERPTNVANVVLNDEVRAVYHGSNAVGLVYYDKSGAGRYRMDIYDKKGNLYSNISFDTEYDDIFFTGENVIIYNATSCLIYTMKGKLRYEGSFEDKVLLMIPTSYSTRYQLVTENGIRLIQLR